MNIVVKNDTKNKQEIHGVINTLPVMPGQTVIVKDKDIPKHEVDRISTIMKVWVEHEKQVASKQEHNQNKEGK